jgi:hypothetical protein
VYAALVTLGSPHYSLHQQPSSAAFISSLHQPSSSAVLISSHRQQSSSAAIVSSPRQPPSPHSSTSRSNSRLDGSEPREERASCERTPVQSLCGLAVIKGQAVWCERIWRARRRRLLPLDEEGRRLQRAAQLAYARFARLAEAGRVISLARPVRRRRHEHVPRMPAKTMSS